MTEFLVIVSDLYLGVRPPGKGLCSLPGSAGDRKTQPARSPRDCLGMKWSKLAAEVARPEHFPN